MELLLYFHSRTATPLWITVDPQQLGPQPAQVSKISGYVKVNIPHSQKFSFEIFTDFMGRSKAEKIFSREISSS